MELAFKRRDKVCVVSRTYKKLYNVTATVTKDATERSAFVRVHFDRPQVGNAPYQKVMGKVDFTCLAWHNLRLMEPPLVAEVEAAVEVDCSVCLLYVTQATA